MGLAVGALSAMTMVSAVDVPSSTAADAPLLFGQLLQHDGTPAAGVDVTVVALHDDVDNIQRATLVATVTTSADGSWSVDDLPVPAGTLLEARTFFNGQPLIYNFAAPGDATGSDSSPLVLQEGIGQVEQSDQATAAAPAAGFVDDTTWIAGAGDVETDQDTSGPADAPDMGAFGAAPDAVGLDASPKTCNYAYVPENKYKKVWVPLKVSRTLTHSRLHYSFTTTKQSDLEIAAYSSDSAMTAGLEGSRNESDSLTVSPGWPHDTSKLVKMQWRYRRYRAWCYGGPPPSPPPTPLNLWKWRPYETLEFTKPVSNNPDFTCRITGPVNSEVILKDTVTTSWGGWFAITVKPPRSTSSITTYLDNKQTQTSSTSLTIDPDAGETARYCGSNSSSLSNSAFVREVT
ncbi:hypothetical protein JCM10369A_32980 [Nocardioides pyridinolyticus]